MHLTIRHLEVFDAVMRAGSISRAAERLNLTQPAVSIALSKLEKALGFRLFHRSKGFFTPTAEAQLLYGEAELSLLAVERLVDRAREISAGVVGGITIASNGASAINFLPDVIADFRRAHPGVQVNLKVRSSRQVASWVAAGQIDIGLLDAPVPVSGVEARIHQLPCVCIMRRADPLAALPRITPADLAGQTIISVTGGHGIDHQVEKAFGEAGVALGRGVIGAYFAILRNMVRAGAGIAIIDCMNGIPDFDDGVTWRPFVPPVTYELALIRASGRVMQKSAELFMRDIEANIAERVALAPDATSATR